MSSMLDGINQLCPLMCNNRPVGGANWRSWGQCKFFLTVSFDCSWLQLSQLKALMRGSVAALNKEAIIQYTQTLIPQKTKNRIQRFMDRSRLFLMENWKHLWIIVLWLGAMAGLFSWKFVQYRHKNAFIVMGYCVCVAKGSIETVKLNMALILLLVCRNSLTWLRSTKLGSFIPFDDNLEFHKASMSTFSMIFSFDSPRLSSLKWKTVAFLHWQDFSESVSGVTRWKYRAHHLRLKLFHHLKFCFSTDCCSSNWSRSFVTFNNAHHMWSSKSSQCPTWEIREVTWWRLQLSPANILGSSEDSRWHYRYCNGYSDVNCILVRIPLVQTKLSEASTTISPDDRLQCILVHAPYLHNRLCAPHCARSNARPSQQMVP